MIELGDMSMRWVQTIYSRQTEPTETEHDPKVTVNYIDPKPFVYLDIAKSIDIIK